MLKSYGLRVLSLMVAALLVGQAPAQERPKRTSPHLKKVAKILGHPAAAAAADGDALQRLFSQRLDAATQAYQAAVGEYEKGLGGLSDVIRETRRLLAAELAMQTTPQGRVAVLEKAVAVAREHEQLIQELVNAGGAPPLLLQDARYDRLTAEITLLQAKADGKSPK